MDKIVLNAKQRKLFGRKVKKLRREGILPGNVFGKGIKSLAVEVDLKEFSEVFKKAGETHVIYLEISKKQKPVLIQNVQLDPVSDDYLHVDFMQVDLTKKVTASVPVEVVGESEAEKTGLGTVVQYINEVEVECLPTDIPEQIQADISKLKTLEDTVVVADLKTSDKVTVLNEADQILVKVEEVKEEVEEEVVAQEEEKEQEKETESEKEEEKQPEKEDNSPEAKEK